MPENQRGFEEMREALRRRREIIADRAHYQRDPGGHLQALKEISERITEIRSRIPDSVDSQFRHYLDRCSYDKALVWLEENISR